MGLERDGLGVGDGFGDGDGRCVVGGTDTVGQECAEIHRHTKVKTVYPPVSLRSVGGNNKQCNKR